MANSAPGMEGLTTQLQPFIVDLVIGIDRVAADSVVNFLHKMSFMVGAQGDDPAVLSVDSLLKPCVQHNHASSR